MSADLALEHVSTDPDEPAEQAPAVVLLHGRGANEQDLLPLAERLPGTFHILSVRAPDRLGPGFTWYELDLSEGGLHASQPDPEDFDRSLELLEAFREGAIETYDLDPDRVGLLGFSQGAILGLSAMIEHTAYAWIGALHGYLPARYGETDVRAAAGVPVFLGAGTNDQIIPATRAENAAERLTAGGVDVTFQTYPVGHTTSPQEIADLREWLDAIETH